MKFVVLSLVFFTLNCNLADPITIDESYDQGTDSTADSGNDSSSDASKDRTDVLMTNAVCNNQILEIGEQCDSSVPEGKTCTEVGFGGGVALCNGKCELDYTNCLALASCGNNKLDTNEKCEGNDLRNETCASQNFDSGVLTCDNRCHLDTSSCSFSCGNGKIGGNEICDGTDLGAKTCGSEKGKGWVGNLTCTTNCMGVDTSACIKVTPHIISAKAFNCRLKLDGKIDCWNSQELNASLGIDQREYIKLSGGLFHVCALDTHQKIKCWGDNKNGQLDGSQENPPLNIANLKFKDVIADGRYTCGLELNNKIKCWGNNDLGQTVVPDNTTYSALAGGKTFACALTTKGGIMCWGSWSAPNPKPQMSWQKPEPGRLPFKQVSAGRYHYCGLYQNGTAKCWDNGAPIPKLGPFTKLSTNTFHTCGLKAKGSLDCWVNASNDEFGKAVSKSGPYIDISTGFYHTCGMKSDLSVECWGITAANGGTKYKGQTVGRPAP